MIKGIIFDMDGVMIDSEPITYNSYVKVLRTYGLDFNLDMYKCLLGRNAQNAKDHLIKWYGEDFPLQEAWDKIYGGVQDELKKAVPLKKGLIELLEYLKANNYKMVVATGSVRSRVEEIVKTANLSSYFCGMVCGDEVQNGKPNPEGFLKACKKLELNPSEALVLEDTDSGILAAYNGNIKVVCIPDMKYPEKENAEKATIVCESLLDVIEYLKKQS